MKILQINKFFYLKGGSEKYFLELRNLLKKNNHQVIDFSMKDKKNLPSPFSEYFIEPTDLGDPVSFRRPGLLFKKILKLIWNKEAQKKLEILIQKEKPDIAHIHNIHHEISLSILPVLKKHKIPVVQTLHDYQIICPNYKLYSQGKICEKCQKHKYYKCFLNKCVRDSYSVSLFVALENYFYWLSRIYDKIDIFIAPSKFLKNKFIEFGIPENKIVYLPNFMEAQKCHSFSLCHSRESGNPLVNDDELKNKREIIKEFRNNKNENFSSKQNNYLLYFGRLSEEKGVDVLIKAMLLINKNIKLKIVGNGPEKENLKKITEKLKINNQIEFFGYKNQNELKEIIKNSLAVVTPSQWYENCPLSILEAFSFGKPVIASNLGGIPELIKNGGNGFLFEPGNAKDLSEKINSLFENSERINSMGKFAQEQIEKKHNPEIHYQKLMEIYQKLK
jgi:glycosyltransferase involved in cell wall biosynthesis